jgi:hypothetical protein
MLRQLCCAYFITDVAAADGGKPTEARSDV